MNFEIHRGTQEVGGSCVEIRTDSARIVIDIGMPLINSDGSEFNRGSTENISIRNLRDLGILPNISGFYTGERKRTDAVLISHPHLDHYGFGNYVNQQIPFYLGEAAYKLIAITRMFTKNGFDINKVQCFNHRIPFIISDLTITPYLNDHSGFDAYGFLIENSEKRIYYTGDFRAHGRKKDIFYQFIKDPPKNVDYLIMEGTNLGENETACRKEEELEKDLITILNKSEKFTLFQTSSQNIDRFVTLTRACIKSNKTLVLDLYTATILKELSRLSSSLPRPGKMFPGFKVFMTKQYANVLGRNNRNLLYYFSRYRIRKEVIEENPGRYVMIIRPSLKTVLNSFHNIDGGDYIYSLWDGYLTKEREQMFKDYLTNRGFKFHHIHTSGHADLITLKKMVNAIKPQVIIPIHTFHAMEYKKHFDYPVKILQDGETINI